MDKPKIIQSSFDFKPKWYQSEVWHAYNKGFRNIILMLGRGGGKDITAWNFTAERACERVGNYFYCLPEAEQARGVIWDNVTLESRRLVDYIPDEIVLKKNESRMSITLKNSSTISLVGSDRWIHSLIGRNPVGMVFSEASTADLDAYRRMAPRLERSNGWALFITTPNGNNEFKELYDMALKHPDSWYVAAYGNKITKHIPQEQVDRLIHEGFISEQLARQEFDCEWIDSINGIIYSEEMAKMRQDGRITHVPHDPSLETFTCFDLGYARNMAVILFQIDKANNIRIFDTLQMDNAGLTDYIRTLQKMPIAFANHYGPHDTETHEISSGLTRTAIARNLGFNFSDIPKLGLEAGIEQTRIMFPRLFIDDKCTSLIKALENYKYHFDNTKKMYSKKPVGDWSSHFADCLRYTAIAAKNARTGITAETINDARTRYLNSKQRRAGRMPRGAISNGGF